MVKSHRGESLEHPEEWMYGLLSRQTSYVSFHNILVIWPFGIVPLIRASSLKTKWWAGRAGWLQTLESQPAFPPRWKAAPSLWGNAARDRLAKCVSSSIRGFGSASAFAQRANYVPRVLQLMHDRNGFGLENSKAGTSYYEYKIRRMYWKKRK